MEIPPPALLLWCGGVLDGIAKGRISGTGGGGGAWVVPQGVQADWRTAVAITVGVTWAGTAVIVWAAWRGGAGGKRE